MAEFTQQQLQAFEQGGIDIQEARERLAGADGLFACLLKMFPASADAEPLRTALAAGNAEAAFAAVHALKGLSGNLSMPKLYKVASLMSDDLRQYTSEGLEVARTRMPQLEEALAQALEAVATLQ